MSIHSIAHASWLPRPIQCHWWLVVGFALCICGLKLDDEAVRVADVDLHLGLNLCIPHQCQCKSMPAASSCVCKQASGKASRHHALNDVVARAFSSAGVPVAKRPHGMTLIPWKTGTSVMYDVTALTSITCTMVCSYIGSYIRDRGRRCSRNLS